MRKKLVAGNWKMYTTAASARQLAASVHQGLGAEDRVRVGLFPPFPYLSQVAETVRGSSIVVGAQNLYPEKEGAFTGEVSPAMLLDCGCKSVILGHSERRHVLGESDAFINRKVRAALAAGLEVILCIGETLQERESKQAEAVFERHIGLGLEGVDVTGLSRVVIAYEPVWAIGTGKTATPELAQESHAYVRNHLAQRYGQAAAAALTILYGGSVKPDNAKALLNQPDIDGALVGGASLQAESFLAIVKAGMSG